MDGLPLVLSSPAPRPVVCLIFWVSVSGSGWVRGEDGVCHKFWGSGSGSRELSQVLGEGGLSQAHDLSQVPGSLS